ncbi:DUF3885 domain-containing protein [Undibacterium sp. Di24W]|uniref:DUF3885 domain-containing protein n=1 Tax=Undibacterium sp. Di24W TaxID=3413033 RepID=UPI003BEFFAFF
MNPKISRSIEDIFGIQVCGDALFYAHPDGLRFELSEGGEPLEQVLTALRKASLICEDLFDAVDSLTVCLRRFAGNDKFALRKVLRELKNAGIAIPEEREIWFDPVPFEDRFDEDIEEWWISLAFQLPTTKLQSLFWCAFTVDFPSLHPNPRCDIYIFNFKDRVLVHPYDDRGMDIIGPNKEFLRKLYVKHNSLLLDYDRARMSKSFE